MPISLPGLPFAPKAEYSPVGDLGAAIRGGLQTYGAGVEAAYKPKTLAENLLKSRLQNEALKFKNTPDYQSALLDFLRGQGAHMWGQTANLPSERGLREAQTKEISNKADIEKQKFDYLRRMMGGSVSPGMNNASYQDVGMGINNQDSGMQMPEGMPGQESENQGSFQNVAYEPENANQFIQPDLAANQEKYRQSILAHKLAGLAPPKVRNMPNGEIVADTGMFGPLVIGAGPSIEQKAILEGKGGQEGKQLAQTEQQQLDQQSLTQSSLDNIKSLKSLMDLPEAKLAFGPASKYTVDLNPFASKKVQELRGALTPLVHSFISQAIQPMRGLGAMNQKEFEKAIQQAPSMDLPYEVNKGKLESLELMLKQSKNRLQLMEKLKSNGLNAQQAQKIAYDTYKLNPFAALAKKLSGNQQKTIEIRNRRTGQKETVSIQEAKKRGVPNV